MCDKIAQALFITLFLALSIFRNLQVSYMIVDEADMEIELTEDPFLEAGIDVPSQLPYTKGDKMDEASRITAAAEAEAQATEAGSGGEDEPDLPSKHLANLRRGVRKLSAWSLSRSGSQVGK